jgi:hypothetical protein
MKGARNSWLHRNLNYTAVDRSRHGKHINGHHLCLLIHGDRLAARDILMEAVKEM